MPQERIPEAGPAEQQALFGPMDRHLRLLRERFGVRITARRGQLLLEGSDESALHEVARRVRRALGRLHAGGAPPSESEVLSLLLEDPDPDGAKGGPPVAVRGRSRPGGPPAHGPRHHGRHAQAAVVPSPLTPNQELYVQAIRKRDIVFSIGPAGTGKTYLAVAEAVQALRAQAVRKMILTRPAVEAGEKLGFLPGDFQAKINPYLRPLYDALGELLPYGEVQRYVDADVIEIVPLAYMRGRTLKDAFIILDEAQNTTPLQMKMFLTRMGMGSKVVVTGDVTQVDLPEDTPSGLVQSIEILERVRGIAVIRFGPQDIQRHPLVQRIVDAYDRAERRRRGIDAPDTSPAARQGLAEPDELGDDEDGEADEGSGAQSGEGA